MRVLVTGHLGKIGLAIVERLQGRGHAVVGFDVAEGADLLDLAAVKRAANRCAAIVHLGALAHDAAGSTGQIMAVNVLGTWHVLLAAEAAGVARVIHFSSVQVLGIAEGTRLPDYFSVGDEHPRRAMRPYGLSKRLAEDLREGCTGRTGIATISLRLGSETHERVAQQRTSRVGPRRDRTLRPADPEVSFDPSAIETARRLASSPAFLPGGGCLAPFYARKPGTVRRPQSSSCIASASPCSAPSSVAVRLAIPHSFAPRLLRPLSQDPSATSLLPQTCPEICPELSNSDPL